MSDLAIVGIGLVFFLGGLSVGYPLGLLVAMNGMNGKEQKE
jgi:hypothetical protein